MPTMCQLCATSFISPHSFTLSTLQWEPRHEELTDVKMSVKVISGSVWWKCVLCRHPDFLSLKEDKSLALTESLKPLVHRKMK